MSNLNFTHTSPAARDFSAATRKALSSKNIAIVGATLVPGEGGSYANGETAYVLNDNGTSRIRRFREVLKLAGV